MASTDSCISKNFLKKKECWKLCHEQVTSVIDCPWSATKINSWTYIGKNCEYNVYLEAMATCLPAYCTAGTWDVMYAKQYGERMCKSAVSGAARGLFLMVLWSLLDLTLLSYRA